MLNHVAMQGRMVADPELRTAEGKTDILNFRLAWSEKYKDRETKCFLDCKAFGGTADFIWKYFGKKGQELIVEGRLTTEEWEKDGQKRSKIVLVVNGAHFCGKKQEGGQEGGQEASAGFSGVEADDLPF